MSYHNRIADALGYAGGHRPPAAMMTPYGGGVWGAGHPVMVGLHPAFGMGPPPADAAMMMMPGAHVVVVLRAHGGGFHIVGDGGDDDRFRRMDVETRRLRDSEILADARRDVRPPPIFGLFAELALDRLSARYPLFDRDVVRDVLARFNRDEERAAVALGRMMEDGGGGGGGGGGGRGAPASPRASSRLANSSSVPSGDLDDPQLCALCVTNRRDVVLRPCRHHTMCGRCAARVSRCPECRRRITGRTACDPGLASYLPTPQHSD